MIHVRVRKQDQIGARHFFQRKGRFDQAPDSNCQRPEIQTDPPAENGIRQDRHAVYLEENRAVPKPGRMQSFIGPMPGMGSKRRRRQGYFSLACAAVPKHGNAAGQSSDHCLLDAVCRAKGSASSCYVRSFFFTTTCASPQKRRAASIWRAPHSTSGRSTFSTTT